ncbi:MAG TPA: molybdate ABC transporter permease subunit [Gaiellales bacterium]|nr:molybdate ABC transporter permease subunit [Gaiellales bacterium]
MLAAGFFLLPLAGIFRQGDLGASLSSPLARPALRVSLELSAVSLITMIAVGTPVAYWMATHDFRGKVILATAFELPLVLPPAVAGLGLFAAFGRTGLLGSELDALGLQIPFTPAAVVMAMTFVAGPFYLRGAQAAFEAVESDLLAAARTLGAGPAKVFLQVAVPVAGAGLGAGAALAWARALGEFGATIMFAGSLQGYTQTAPVAIYLGFEQGAFGEVFGLGAILVALSGLVVLAAKLIARGRLPRFEPS